MNQKTTTPDGVGNRSAVTSDETAPETGSYYLNPATPEPADYQMNQYSTTPVGTMTHDKNGNLKYSNQGTGSQRGYSYDYRNLMLSTSFPGGIGNYQYDAFGRRITRSETGVGIVAYYYLGFRVVEEQTQFGSNPAPVTPAATYVYGAYIDDVLTMRRNGQDYYYHADDLFNVVKVTNSSGAVIERYDYSDYGMPLIFIPGDEEDTLIGQSAIGNPYLWNGRNWDKETGSRAFKGCVSINH